jgi:hypothetical protein
MISFRFLSVRFSNCSSGFWHIPTVGVQTAAVWKGVSSMRKALITMIVTATALTPLAVQAQPARVAPAEDRSASEQRFAQRGERQGRGEARQQREARPQQRGERRESFQRNRTQAPAVQQRQQRQPAVQQRQQRQQAAPAQTTQRRDRDGRITTGWEGPRNDPRLREHQQRYDQRARENALRYGTPEQRREVRRDVRQDRRDWDRSWRNNNRYDWQRWRYSNRHIYRLPPYYAPYRGHRYSRFSIGIILGAPLYHQRYWISDPWHYRLPPAPPGYQWVRYYNDVLLVDTWNGRVVDVIYDFFW